jgi:hypothetical protein
LHRWNLRLRLLGLLYFFRNILRRRLQLRNILRGRIFLVFFRMTVL